MSRCPTRLAFGGSLVAPWRSHQELSTDRRGASAWLVSLWVFGRDQRVNFVAFIGYLVLQGFRFWVMRTLGSRWTTRIIVCVSGPSRRLDPINSCRIPTMRWLPSRSQYWFLVSHTWPPSSRFSTLRFSRTVPAINRCGIFVMRQMPRESRHGGKLPTHDNGEKGRST
jgi:hypothetical protein